MPKQVIFSEAEQDLVKLVVERRIAEIRKALRGYVPPITKDFLTAELKHLTLAVAKLAD